MLTTEIAKGLDADNKVRYAPKMEIAVSEIAA